MNSLDLLYCLNNVNDNFIENAKPKNLFITPIKSKPIKKRYILLVSILVTLLLVACTVATFIFLDLTFPFTNKDKTQYNSAIYEVEPFNVTIALPNNFSFKEREFNGFDNNIALTGTWSVMDIVSNNNQVVGAIGYNIYEEYEGAEDLPQAIYNQIALGNDYHFDVRASYSIVNETKVGTTAIVDVYYSPTINNGTEKINKGIVSYNKNLLVYIAIEFNSEKINDEDLQLIAQSISFTEN